jgi:uncharacterized protein YggU (UPF0235/DUF167 family)
MSVHVKAGAHRDGVWRDGDGLFVRLRAIPTGGQANKHLISYLSGSLRVAPSLVTVLRGITSNHKIINIEAPEVDLRPMLDGLPDVPQSTLFDE